VNLNTQEEVRDAADSVTCLLKLAAKLNAAVSPGHADDVVDLRLTKRECAMLMALISDAFR
jgi:hypothetical protein